jgi:hypothetical protein
MQEHAMKRVVLSLATVVCLSVPALADEDSRRVIVERAETVVEHVEPAAPPAPIYIGHHDGCGHHGARIHDKFAEPEDLGPGFRHRRLYGR